MVCKEEMMNSHKPYPSRLTSITAIAVLAGMLLTLGLTALAQDITWTDMALPVTEGWLEGMHVLDKNTAWIVGQGGRADTSRPVILHTNDGETWAEQDSGIEQGSLSDVFFIDAKTGYAVGQDFSTGFPIILRTTDGGETWERNPVPDIHGFLNDITFTPDGVGWCAGVEFDNFQSLLLRSDDGVNWTVQSHPAIAEGGFDAIVFSTPATGFAFGSTFPTEPEEPTTPAAVKTTDGGDTWTEMALPVDEGSLSDAAFSDGETGWLVGGHAEEAFVLETADGGDSWNPIDGPEGTLATSVFFLSPMEGFVTVNQQEGETWTGTLYHTIDGGETWASILEAPSGEAMFNTQAVHGSVTVYVVSVDKKQMAIAVRKGNIRPPEPKVPPKDPTPRPTKDTGGGGGGGGDDDGPGPLAMIVVIPKTADLHLDQTQQYTVVGYDTDKNKVPVRGPITWSASGGTIDADGLFTATDEGEFVITAVHESTGLSATAVVFVTLPGVVLSPLPWLLGPWCGWVLIALGTLGLVGFIIWYLIKGRQLSVPIWVWVIAAVVSSGCLCGVVWLILSYLVFSDSDGFCGLQGHEFSLDISVSMR
jgi:photosystem II stability/assembly factor-like uncharacterized protein